MAKANDYYAFKFENITKSNVKKRLFISSITHMKAGMLNRCFPRNNEPFPLASNTFPKSYYLIHS